MLQSRTIKQRRHLGPLTSLCAAMILVGAGPSLEEGQPNVWGDSGMRHTPVLYPGRDPIAFLKDFEPVLQRPIVALSQQDAVARELLLYSRTMTESDALITAQTLCFQAKALGWDPLMYVAIIRVESNYNHLAISNVGAEGLMQIMPPTAQWLSDRLKLDWPEHQSFDPVLNVRLGTHYLAYLQRSFSSLGAILTAYNRGPNATRDLISTHGAIPREILKSYSDKVLAEYRQLRSTYRHLDMAA